MCGRLLQRQENPTQHQVVILHYAHAPTLLSFTALLRLLETTTSVKQEPPCHAAQRECSLPTIHYLMVKVVAQLVLAVRTTVHHGSAEHYLNLPRMI